MIFATLMTLIGVLHGETFETLVIIWAVCFCLQMITEPTTGTVDSDSTKETP